LAVLRIEGAAPMAEASSGYAITFVRSSSYGQDAAVILFLPSPFARGERMSSLKEFQCEICRIVSQDPVRWFVIECGDQKLSIIKWDLTAALSPTARHFCGEAHAQVYISRWFESICVPMKPASKVS
jgi:hypothetical protein